MPNITLIITHSKMDKLYPQFSKREILCGPNLQNKDTKERKYIRTSGYFFDIDEVLSHLNKFSKIELVILSIQAHVTCFPKNLYKINCPKIAIINETDHQMYPISIIINYLKQENIKHILVSAQAAHLHFFYEAGIKHSALYPRPMLEFKSITNKISGVTYIGKKWKSSHIRRSRMIRFLKRRLPKHNIPFNYYNQVSYSEWLKLLSQSKMFVISSLNGQLTPQVYIALSAGVLCFIDELSHQTLVYRFFEHKKHLITWYNFEDLLEKIIYYYDHPKEAEIIAKAGKQQVNKFVINKNRATMISEFVFEDKINPNLLAINDKRCQDTRVEYPDYFNARIRLYENIQELHRIYETLSLISLTRKNLKPISDLADLPRLEITHAFTFNEFKNEADFYFRSVGVDHQIKTVIYNDINKSSIYDIGILESQKSFIVWQFLTKTISNLLKKNSLLWVFGRLTPTEHYILSKYGFKPYKFKNNFIKNISRKICLWFWKKGKYPFPYLTIKPAMKTVPNLNVFIRGWQSKFSFLY